MATCLTIAAPFLALAGGVAVLWTISIILLGLWVLGVASGAQTGFWVHLFLLSGLTSGALALARRGRLA